MSKSHYIIPIFVAQEGCPHNCVFCNQHKITGEKDEMIDENYVRETIEAYIKTIDRENSTLEVSFFGGTFTGIPIERQKSLLKVAKEYKDKGQIDYIHMSTRPDYIDREILDNLKEYSADIIELGVQSLDDEVLLKSGRGHSVEEVHRASKLIREYGFTLGHQIMLGLPGDTFKKDIETVAKSLEMEPDIARIYPALVIKDTPMEDMLKKGTYKPYTLDETIDITMLLYSMYEEQDVKVIRIGLQPTEEINENKDVLGGPFHPAFRELVEGKIINEAIFSHVEDSSEENLEIYINNKDISKLYCNKKQFFNEFIDKKNVKRFKVIQDETLNRGNIIIKKGENQEHIFIKEYMRKLSEEGKNLFI
ncbi:TPA: radical SAM protein [Clostridium botulinum]|nr:radical SAM protein [Clostridium botulinum]HCL4458313.1 radical SAM protein [Clostridium botulinum]HCL4462226.1 radical SAM protein [Clostridium botulinum]HCL4473285.1 radical SAM protein [Clostridium botulinum]HCL4476876.1 radical SAM protein [Clostridium botulinum]